MQNFTQGHAVLKTACRLHLCKCLAHDISSHASLCCILVISILQDSVLQVSDWLPNLLFLSSLHMCTYTNLRNHLCLNVSDGLHFGTFSCTTECRLYFDRLYFQTVRKTLLSKGECSIVKLPRWSP